MMFLFDKELNVISAIFNAKHIKDGTVTEQINGEYSCTITVPWDASTQATFKEFNHVGFYVDGEFQVFQIRTINDERASSANREVYCEHLSYQLANYVTEDRRIVDGTARDILQRILVDTDWQLGEVANLGEKTYNAFYIETRKALLEIAELYGGELRYRLVLDESNSRIIGKYVDLVTTRGDNTGIRFSPNKNLSGLTREIDTLEMRTRLIGRGYSPQTDGGGQERKIQFTDAVWSVANGNPADKPEGQNWIADIEAEAKYGVICGVYEDRSETSEELLQNTWDKLMTLNEPTITYTASLAFIRKYMSGKSMLSVGDHFTIIDDDLGLHMNTRILQITRDWYNQQEGSVTMGQFYKTIGDSSSELDDIKSDLDDIRDTIGNINPDITDTSFPDVLPAKSVITTKSLFASIQVDWTYEYGIQYEYALYGSQTKGFAPNQANLLYRGKGSSYLHYTTPNQTWYYRVCAFNSRGNKNEYSAEAVGTSLRITDASNYMENASIKDAQIGELRLDRGWVGKLEGQWIDARELTVTDGNGHQTLYVDSFGRLHGDFTTLNIMAGGAGNIATSEDITNAVGEVVTNMDIQLTDIMNANNTTLEYVNLITSDDYITETERADVKRLYDDLTYQYTTILSTIAKFDNEYLNGYGVLLTTAYETVEPLMESIVKGATDGALEFRDALTIYYNKYNDCLHAISSFTKDQLTDLSSQITANANGIQMAVSQSSEGLAEIKRYMTFTPEGWLELHGSINGNATQFKTQLSDTKLAFYDGGNEVASISNRELNIDNARINTSLAIGKYMLSPSASGGIVIRKGV